MGSLPFTDPERAAAHAVAAYDIPFCPQLPRLEGAQRLIAIAQRLIRIRERLLSF